ncbi:unnamed protein product [Lota lota]
MHAHTLCLLTPKKPPLALRTLAPRASPHWARHMALSKSYCRHVEGQRLGDQRTLDRQGTPSQLSSFALAHSSSTSHSTDMLPPLQHLSAGNAWLLHSVGVALRVMSLPKETWTMRRNPHATHLGERPFPDKLCGDHIDEGELRAHLPPIAARDPVNSRISNSCHGCAAASSPTPWYSSTHILHDTSVAA